MNRLEHLKNKHKLKNPDEYSFHYFRVYIIHNDTVIYVKANVIQLQALSYIWGRELCGHVFAGISFTPIDAIQDNDNYIDFTNWDTFYKVLNNEQI